MQRVFSKGPGGLQVTPSGGQAPLWRDFEEAGGTRAPYSYGLPAARGPRGSIRKAPVWPPAFRNRRSGFSARSEAGAARELCPE
jgi:hypothetical protein